jgi:hypothetical protein
VEINKRSHPFYKGRGEVFKLTSTQIDVLKKASATARKINFKADISINTITFCVIADLVKPNVTLLNPIKGCFNQLRRSTGKEPRVHIKTTLYPRQVRTTGLDKLNSIRVGVIKVAHNSTILVNTTTPQGFVEG